MAGEELPPAVQDFIANVEDYVGPLRDAIAAAEEFAAANDKAAEAALHMAEDIGVTATAVADSYATMARAAQEEAATVVAAAGSAAEAQTQLADSADRAAASMSLEAIAAESLKRALADMPTSAGGALFGAAGETGAGPEAAFLAAEALKDVGTPLAAFDESSMNALKTGLGEAAALAHTFYDQIIGVGGQIRDLGDSAENTASKLDRMAGSLDRIDQHLQSSDTASGGMSREAAAAAAAADAVGHLNDAQAGLAATSGAAADAEGKLAETTAATAAASTASAAATAMSAREMAAAAASAGRYNAAATLMYTDQLAAGAAAKAAAADAKAAAAANGDAANGMDDVGQAAQRAGRFLWLTGTQWHWLIAGSAEFLAVTIPAMVALGAASLDAAQGVQMVQEHMQSLWTAAEATGNMFHETMGQALGFKDALQQAQDTANNQVFEGLGGAIDMVGGKFSAFAAGSDKSLTQVKSGFQGLAATGNQVLNVMDGFVAHLQYDMVSGGGATVSGLLSNMVPDLTELGQVLGNAGHALLNFAADMPGLAEVLLKVIDAISQLVLWVTELGTAGHYLIMFAMAAEEFYRWGGLVNTLLSKIGLASKISTEGLSGGAAMAMKYAGVLATIGGVIPKIIGNLMQFGGVALSAIGKVVPQAEAAGTAFQHWGAQMKAFASDTVSMAWLGGLIVAVLAVGVALDKVRSSTQLFIDSINKAVASASNLDVLNVLSNGLAESSARMSEQQGILDRYSPSMQNLATSAAASTEGLRRMEGPLAGVGEGASNVNDKINMFVAHLLGAIPAMGGMARAYENLTGATRAANSIQQLTAAQKQWLNQSVNVVQGAGAISHEFGTNFVGSLELAQTAGVNLTQKLTGMSQAAVINRLKIADLVAGYSAMGQNSGAVSADMEDLAVQSGLAATKVSQLNQAMQQYMQNVTGGTSGLASFVTSMQNIGDVVGKVSNNLGESSSINLSTRQFAESLKSMAGSGAQAWTNFNQVVGSTAPQLISWFNTAGAEGMMSGQHMRQGVLDVISGLIPLAKDSTTAQAEVLALARSNGVSAGSFGQLESKVKDAHASVKGMNAIVGQGTIGMSNLEKVAENLGNVMSSQIVGAMDKAKLAASGLSTDASNLANALTKPHTPAKTLNTDIGNIYKTVLSLTGSKSQAESTTQAYADGFGQVGKAAFKAWQQTGQAAPGIPKAFAQGIEGGKTQVIKASTDMGRSVIDGVQSQNLPGKMQTTGHQAGQGMFSGLTSMLGQIGHWALSVNSTVSGYLNRLPGELLSIGANAGMSVARGLESAIGSIVGAAESIASAIPNTIKKLLGMASPSVVMQKIGTDTIQGLVNGLTGGKKQITAAINDMIKAVKSAFSSGMISATAESAYTGWLTADNRRLHTLAAERQSILKTIATAEAYSKNVASSTTSTFSLVNAAGTGGAGTFTTGTIITTLRQDLTQIKQFKSNINKLKKMGLDKAYLNQIIQAGPVTGGPIAAELVSTGVGDIGTINSLESQISAASTSLGHAAANDMYDSGKQAGKGFLSGLEAQKRNIENLMEKIAKDMVKTLKRELGISSPSAVMRPHGQAVVDGLIAGIQDRLPALDAEMRRIGITTRGGSSGLIPVHAGGGSVGQPIELRMTVMLDGKQLQTSTQKQTLRYNKRNLSNGLALAR